MRSKGTGSDDDGRGRFGGLGRGRRARHRTADLFEPGPANDPWADDQWDDGWTDRTRPGRDRVGPRPAQVDAWLESDPDGGEITRDIAQRWTGTEIPAPGGTWTDEPAESFDADDDRAERPDPAAVATPSAPAMPVVSFESLDDEDDLPSDSDDTDDTDEAVAVPAVAPEPVVRSAPAVATSLFAAPADPGPAAPDEPEVAPPAAPFEELDPASAAPAFDTHPFEEADTFAAEPPQPRRHAAADDHPVAAARAENEPDHRVAADDEATAPTTRSLATSAAASVPEGAHRTLRLIGHALVVASALRVLLVIAAVFGTTDGGPLPDRLADLSGKQGSSYAFALVVGVVLLALGRSGDDDGSPVALGLAFTSAIAMLVGAMLTARLDFRAYDAINEAGGDQSIADLARTCADAAGPVLLGIAAAWAALRSSSDR